MHAMQLTLVDTTAMPLQGYVFLTALPGPNGYDPAWNAALASTQCMLPNITVCAYNAISNTQVRHGERGAAGFRARHASTGCLCCLRPVEGDAPAPYARCPGHGQHHATRLAYKYGHIMPLCEPGQQRTTGSGPQGIRGGPL